MVASLDRQPAGDIDVESDAPGLPSDRAPTRAWADVVGVIAPEFHPGVGAVAARPVVAASADPVADRRHSGDAVDETRPARPLPDVGVRLEEPGHTPWSRPSRLGLTADMTAGESFTRIVVGSLCHLDANQDCARRNLHIEGVHQCRVALRRLRSAFKIFQPLLRRERIAPIEDTVCWLSGILGTARDLDVFQVELLEPAVAALGRSQPLAVLTAGLEARKAAAYDAVGEALSSARCRRLLDALRQFGQADDFSPPGANGLGLDQPVAGLAARALSRAHQKLLRRGSGFEILSMAERHDVRIALKRLRYALDFFAGLFDGGSKKRFTRRVARLQDALGRMNDVAVADTMLAQLVGIAAEAGEPVERAAPPRQLVFAAGSVLGWYRHGAADIDRRLVKDWYEFVRAKPFWLRQENAAA